MKTRTRGFTLVELLIAMSLFLVLGTALVALLSKAMDFMSAGATGTEVIDKAADFLRPFQTDLENVVVERSLNPGAPGVRFYSDFVPLSSTGRGKVDYYAQRLAFVRSTREEAADVISRMAGTRAGAKKYIDGKNDGEEAEKRQLRAPGGLQEVLYMAVPDNIKDPGSLTLYRAIRTPVGGKGSLLDPKTIRSVEDLKKIGQPLMSGVLHFQVRFWSGDTRSWEVGSDVPSREGPTLSWDSTRGLLPIGFRANQFPLARGTESLTDPRDDISPRAIRVTFVFEQTGSDVTVARLIEDIDERTPRAVVDSTEFTNIAEDKYIKVGTEWMTYASVSGDTFTIMKRGARGTESVPHALDEMVRAGALVERVIPIPSYKEERSLR